MTELTTAPMSLFRTTEFVATVSSDDSLHFILNTSYNNATANTTSSTVMWNNPPFVYSLGLIILLACCSVICLLGCFGNVLVITVFCRWPRMRTVTNYYIFNLALVDLIIVSFSIPNSAITEVMHSNDRYSMGEGMCKFASTLRYIVLNVSTLTLVAISLDRYVAVVYPLKSHPSKKKTVIILLSIWLISIAANSPLYFFLKIFTFGNNSPWAYCIIMWSPRLSEEIYVGITFALLFALPMAIMHYTNCSIAYTTWRSGTMTDYSATLPQPSQPYQQHHKKRRQSSRSRPSKRRKISVSTDNHGKRHVVTLVICIVLTFTICMMPLQVVKVLIYYRIVLETASNRQSLRFMILFLRLLSYSNSMINPLLYVIFSTKFRDGCKALRYGYRFSSSRSTSNVRFTQQQTLSKRCSSHSHELKRQKSSMTLNDKENPTGKSNQLAQHRPHVNQSQSLYAREMEMQKIELHNKSQSFCLRINPQRPPSSIRKAGISSNTNVNHHHNMNDGSIEMFSTQLCSEIGFKSKQEQF
ncbi:uncharacterized protein TRIADDRAFT_61975 [Trichoplax adhaerens]|uniref:G-protein coupled receptors family 1 profile domain-containing protein n=1 Tax=Trichoplax adhaerens TaxID=10228 RepID=B3SCH8_TRIAD|nr:hypothetical protein TRIADDRAFT_61975 [Trichoplax adhaerens]EDV19598.1 hypothetical protein TRIADDRAFT_61975 [Trichoplax adhaerens]|eukprot:XP_002117931.1 hypothetical protein TRIADDRAFT_61975 [Trichoplax adhaerens]